MRTISSLPFLLLCLAIAGCKTTEIAPTTVEHLLMPLPMPESGWIVTTKRDGPTEWTRWNKENEFLSLAITREPPDRSPHQQMLSIDSHARDNIAKSFRTVLLQEDQAGLAQRVIWTTHLVFPSERQAFSICLLLHGNDASYFIIKQWDSEDEYIAEYDFWLSYLTTIHVEDPRLAP